VHRVALEGGFRGVLIAVAQKWEVVQFSFLRNDELQMSILAERK
jgi:hypothetical protein